jgi:hypothetical protein
MLPLPNTKGVRRLMDWIKTTSHRPPTTSHVFVGPGYSRSRNLGSPGDFLDFHGVPALSVTFITV